MKNNYKIISNKINNSYNRGDGWRSRGYLPHYDRENLTQFITFRLYDSLPQEKLQQLELELKIYSPEEKNIERIRKIEEIIDAGYGECYLANNTIATIVEKSILYFSDIRYKIHGYVIMPNHVHLLLTVVPNYSLSRILQSLKSYSARECNKIIHKQGNFWSPEYYDRYIRDQNHFQNVLRYITNNPVKAGLCSVPEEWRYLKVY